MGAFTTQRGTAWEIVRDQRAYNVLKPNGASALNWYLMGRRGTAWSSPSFDTADPWGQIYLANGATYEADILAKFGSMEMWALSLATGLWSQLKSQARPDGAHYPENFSGSSTPWTAKSNSPALMIAGMTAGYNLHFFPTGRNAIDPADTLAIASKFSAKIISASGADISSKVGMLIGAVGNDLWADGVITTGNGDAIVSSHAALQPYYQRFRSIVTNGASDWAILKQYGVPTGFEQLTDTSYTPGVDPDYVA